MSQLEREVANTEDKNATGAGTNISSNKVSVETPNTQLNNLSKYFVKDILNILESTDKKGKTKLKEIRRKMYGYLGTY